MSNGTIITPLTPDENICGNNETPNEIYSPSDSLENKTKESAKLDIKNFCKKINCLEIIFLIFYIIFFASIIISIIIKIRYIFPLFTIVYFFVSLFPFYFFLEMIIKQKYGNSALILSFLIVIPFCLAVDLFIYFTVGYEDIKANNEFKANFVKYLRFGEISLWAFLICLLMCLTYKRTGKICYEPEEGDNS